jgi:hypothetical protein
MRAGALTGDIGRRPWPVEPIKLDPTYEVGSRSGVCWIALVQARAVVACGGRILKSQCRLGYRKITDIDDEGVLRRLTRRFNARGVAWKLESHRRGFTRVFVLNSQVQLARPLATGLPPRNEVKPVLAQREHRIR